MGEIDVDLGYREKFVIGYTYVCRPLTKFYIRPTCNIIKIGHDIVFNTLYNMQNSGFKMQQNC